MRSSFRVLLLWVLFTWSASTSAQSSLDQLRNASDRAQEHVRPRAKLLPSDTLFELRDVDVAPEFPGGESALRSYIAKALRMPEGVDALPPSHVVVQFVVAQRGRNRGTLRSALAGLRSRIARYAHLAARHEERCCRCRELHVTSDRLLPLRYYTLMKRSTAPLELRMK